MKPTIDGFTSDSIIDGFANLKPTIDGFIEIALYRYATATSAERINAESS